MGMSIDRHGGLCMHMYMCVGACMTVYSYVWLCIAMYIASHVYAYIGLSETTI